MSDNIKLLSLKQQNLHAWLIGGSLVSSDDRFEAENLEQLADALAANAQLRGYLIAAGHNAGGMLLETVSNEFLCHVPDEVRLKIEKVEGERDALQVQVDQLSRNVREILEAHEALQARLDDARKLLGRVSSLVYLPAPKKR